MTARDKALDYYARYPTLRNVPVIGSFLDNLSRAKTDLSARVKVQHALGPVLAIKDLKTFHRTAPRKYTGRYLLNLLGLHPARILFHLLKWRVRRILAPRSSGPVEKIQQDLDQFGVVVLQDIFSQSEISALKEDFTRLAPHFTAHFPEFKAGLVIPTEAAKPWDKPLGSETARRLLAENSLLNEVISSVSGHKIKLTPEVSYMEYRPKPEELDQPQVDGQDVLHADVVYPSFKIFVYVTDTDESNGAFRYCPGSHKLSFKRLVHEYKTALRYYQGLRQGEYKPVHIPEEEKETLELKEVAQVGKSGTVIIFNTMGFHRRGEFRDKKTPFRHVIMCNYRFLDTLANTLSLPV